MINSQVRQIRLDLLIVITLDANDKRQQHLAWMLAKHVADNASSGLINVLPRQMTEETYQPREIAVTGYIYRTASQVSWDDSSRKY